MSITFNSRAKLSIGNELPLVVNCNVGANSLVEIDSEKEKINFLFSKKETTPDMMMDLSLYNSEDSLARYVIDKFGIPVGIVPDYLAYSESDGIEEGKLLDIISEYAKLGVSFMTIHLTADNDILEVAKRDRKIPVTSRGGALVLADSYKKRVNKNVYRRCLDKIINVVKKYNIAISLGTTFRPAGIVDACDLAHTLETQRQISIAKYLKEHGVKVMMENVGHIPIHKMESHCALLKAAGVPIMPLGPLPIDSAIGYDHIASAIGASVMALNNCIAVVNAISPSEHLHSKFSKVETAMAIISAKIVCKSFNIDRNIKFLDEENNVYNHRAGNNSCIMSCSTDCIRCNRFCPLKMIGHDF